VGSGEARLQLDGALQHAGARRQLPTEPE
jgi:hypothetical protein